MVKVLYWHIFFSGLQASTISLDFRVTALEENGGNSSVAELEVRVETLEGTANDHETRISSTESDIAGDPVLKIVVPAVCHNHDRKKPS